jgi:signal transduction histidine kinase
MERPARVLLEMSRSILSELDVEVVLNRVLEAACELTGSRYAALGVLDASKHRLARFVTVGIDPSAHQAIGTLPTGRGVLGELIRNPAPLRLDDVSAHPRSFGFPPGHPPMGAFLGVPVLVREEPYGNLYLTEKVGGPYTAEDEEAALALAEVAGVAIDNARRFTGSEQRRRELEQTVAALDATTQIARALGAETDLQVILELVAKRARALVSARAVAVALRRGDDIHFAYTAGDVAPALDGAQMPLSGSVAEIVLRTGRSERLSDHLNRIRFEFGLGRFGVTADAGVVVPLRYRGTASGVLYVLDRLEDGPEFTARDERLLEAFATSAATAVATAQAVAEQHGRQRLAAAEEERARWARELHDETLQALGGLRLLLATARRSGRPEVMAEAMGDAIGQLEADIANLRALITELRPAALDQIGTQAAIEALAARMEQAGMTVRVHCDLAYEQGRATTRHVPELETAMYRLVQEGLTNAAKHGRAGRCTVEVVEDDRQIVVTVSDDGDGFDPAQQSAGFGLVGMRERVELLDGRLAVDSSAGGGTTVTAWLPVRRRDEPVVRAV